MRPSNEPDFLRALEDADRAAIEAVVAHYRGRALRRCEMLLPPAVAQRLDAEDVVQIAFWEFVLALRSRRFAFAQLADVERLLWRILKRKIIGEIRAQFAAKRDVRLRGGVERRPQHA